MTPLRLDLSDPSADLTGLVDALLAGGLVVLPTDTVYGLACDARLAGACERAVRLKGRELDQPSAILCASLDTALTSALPGLSRPVVERARRLLPGQVTLVVPNPERRFAWLCGRTPERIGLRVPVLEPRLARAVDQAGVLLATSANLHGAADPRVLDEVPAAVLDAVDVVVDGGPLAAGRPSTVVDITGPEPIVLREGAVPAERIRVALEA